MKKSIVFICLFAMLGVAASDAPVVNEKVLKAFNQTFANASDVVWYEVQNGYEARFKISEIISRVIYDKHGRLLSSTRYYNEENLPTNILLKLKKQYAGKTVHGVTEVGNEENVIYYIHLVDNKRWYTVKAEGWGDLELKEYYNKAD